MTKKRRGPSKATLGLGMVVALGLLVAVFLYVQSLQVRPAVGMKVKSSSPTITEVQRMDKLLVLKVYVADVLATTGYDYRGAWLIKGDALVAVDMRKARFQAVDEEAKTLVLLVPPPEVISSRVDHEKTQTWDVEKTTWMPWVAGDEDKLRDEAMREAQRMVSSAAGDKDNIDQARIQAELMLENMYQPIDWKVDVEWQDQ